MRHCCTLAICLIVFLAASVGVAAMESATGTPSPVSLVPGFSMAPVPQADQSITDKGYFIYDLAAGDESTGSVRLENPGEEPVTVELAAVDAQTARLGGNAYGEPTDTPVAVGSWLELTESRVTLDPGEQAVVEFAVKTPAKIKPGQYLGGISALVPTTMQGTATTSNAGGAGATLSVQPRYVIAVEVDVPGEWTPSMTITGASALEVPSGTKLGIAMENTGDTFIAPTGSVTLTNAQATPILEQPIKMSTFLTGSDIVYPVAWPGAPEAGQYAVDVELNYADDKTATYRGAFAVSDNAPVAQPAPGAEPQPAAQPEAAPAPAASFLQPWMIYTIIGLLALVVILFVVVLLHSRRNATL
jgi:hypothetical protein